MGAAQRVSGRVLCGRGCMPWEQIGSGASGRGRGSVQWGLCGSGSNSDVLRWRLPEGAARPGAAQRGWAPALGIGGCAARRANPTAQASEHRAPGYIPGIGLPRDRQRPGGPRTARTLLPRAEQSSGPPRSLQALQTESSGATAGADSRAPGLALPLRLFLLGPHGVNNPH